jgi:hypothetical protein
VAVVPVADRPLLTITIAKDLIATRALIELGVIAADETPSANDQDWALANVYVSHEALVAQANVRWTIDTIPDAVADEYSRLTALRCASSFGKTSDPKMLELLEGRVRSVSMIMQAPGEAATAVMAVHNDLAARGLVRWTSQDIPDAAGTAYMLLAANLLAPSFGAQADADAAAVANASLARMIALDTSGERVAAEYF